MRIYSKYMLWCLAGLLFVLLVISILPKKQNSSKALTLKDVPEIDEFTISQKDILYRIYDIRIRSGGYTFRFSPVKKEGFKQDQYVVNCSGKQFNNIIREVDYITKGVSRWSEASATVWEELKAPFKGFADIVRHPIETAKGIIGIPTFLYDKTKEFIDDPNILNILKSFYIDQLKETAKKHEIDFDTIKLDETIVSLKKEVNTKLYTISGIAVATIAVACVCPPAAVSATGAESTSIISKATKLCNSFIKTNKVEEGIKSTKIVKAASNESKVSNALKTSEAINNRSLLRQRMGIKGDWEAHHIIPYELKDHPILRKIGLDINSVENGIALPTKPNLHPKLPLHRGNHPPYNNAVKADLDKIPANLSAKETEKRVNDVIAKYRQEIEDGTPLHKQFFEKDKPWG